MAFGQPSTSAPTELSSVTLGYRMVAMVPLCFSLDRSDGEQSQGGSWGKNLHRLLERGKQELATPPDFYLFLTEHNEIIKALEIKK